MNNRPIRLLIVFLTLLVALACTPRAEAPALLADAVQPTLPAATRQALVPAVLPALTRDAPEPSVPAPAIVVPARPVYTGHAQIDDAIPEAVADRFFRLANDYGDVGIRRIVAVYGRTWTVRGESSVVYVNVDAERGLHDYQACKACRPSLVDEFTWHYARRAYHWLKRHEPGKLAIYERSGGWQAWAKDLIGVER